MFVDAEGKKAGSWTLQELAMLLRTGAASLADPAARSLVDQAFLSVLHSLFSDLCQQAVGGAARETTPSISGVAHDASGSSPEPESGEGFSEYPPREPAPDWAACLEQALDEEALELWVQPIESRTSRLVMGLRLVPRVRFAGQVLHLPEETEGEELTARLQELGRRVIRDTLGWLAARSEGSEVEVLVIALSSVQLTDPLLIEYTIERLMESTVPPSKLCFELAEATVLAHPMEVLHVVGTLRELGCRILISGLGGSGAMGEYLSRVSADFLAVDRRFIAGMVTDPRHLAVVKSSQEMARTLGRKTLAEGVESDEQGRIIGDLGIDYLVGPLRPPPHLQSESG
jgi:EAL domain-containing protein (putative c-di-GMP-specific phosphodiesterase class I)